MTAPATMQSERWESGADGGEMQSAAMGRSGAND